MAAGAVRYKFLTRIGAALRCSCREKLFLRQRFLSTTFPAHKENRPCSKATGAVRYKCLTMTY
ncbi:MAG TPA: hypothetical protein DDZ08_04860, partial [Cobetia sp.]|nr:hypothetical protein [Cobetia sp.]